MQAYVVTEDGIFEVTMLSQTSDAYYLKPKRGTRYWAENEPVLGRGGLIQVEILKNQTIYFTLKEAIKRLIGVREEQINDMKNMIDELDVMEAECSSS